MVTWTAIICSFNSGKRLIACLESVLKLEEKENLEIIVIDNASTDDTSKNLESFLKRNSITNVKLIYEPKQGLSYARFRGVREASGQFIIFVDDDNLPNSDYLKVAQSIFQGDWNIGIIGGRSSLPSTTKCPFYLTPFIKSLAVGEPFIKNGYVSSSNTIWGACMCIKSAPLKEYVRLFDSPLFPDRSGKTLLSAGDGEIHLFVMAQGYLPFYSNNLHFYHDISPHRLKLSYLCKLYYSFGILREPYNHLKNIVIKTNSYLNVQGTDKVGSRMFNLIDTKFLFLPVAILLYSFFVLGSIKGLFSSKKFIVEINRRYNEINNHLIFLSK